MTASVRVRVRPGAREERLRGWHGDGALKVEVTAPPEGGRANEAVIRLLAGALGLPRDRLRIVRGHTARKKVILIEGLDEAQVRARLEAAR